MTGHDDGGRLRTRSEGVLLLAVLFLGYMVYATDRYVLAAVLKPLASSLDLSSLATGLISSAQFIGVAAVVFVAGALSDRYGAKRVVLAGVVTFTAFTWLVAFSANFYQAFALRLVSGVGEGLFWPVAMAWVSDWFGARKGLALGVFYVGFDVGQIAGDVIGGATFGATGDWRTAFLVAPTMGLAVIAGLLLTGPSLGTKKEGTGGVSLGRGALGLLRRRSTLLIMLFAPLATWASLWQAVFLPYYYATVLGLSVPDAAYLAAILPAAGAFGKISLGAASDFRRREGMLLWLSLGVAVLYGLFFLAGGVLLAALISLAMGFVSASVFPIVQAYMADASGGFSGTGLGLTTSAQSVATVFAPTITGYLFYLGVGRAIALDALVPSVGMIVVAVALVLEGRRHREALYTPGEK